MQSIPKNDNTAAEQAVLNCYEEIAAASQLMLETARNANWDGLVAAEMVCANLINKVSKLSKDAQISEEGNRHRMQIIHRVLAHDAQIRNLVEPQLLTLEGFLQGRANNRRVENAYKH
jgi:flagellar protein FliT